MSHEEFAGWILYLDSRPPGWRDDDRAFKLLQAQGVKAKPWEIFESLRAIYSRKPVEPVGEEIHGLTRMSGSVGMGMFSRIRSAIGGEEIPL